MVVNEESLVVLFIELTSTQKRIVIFTVLLSSWTSTKILLKDSTQ